MSVKIGSPFPNGIAGTMHLRQLLMWLLLLVLWLGARSPLFRDADMAEQRKNPVEGIFLARVAIVWLLELWLARVCYMVFRKVIGFFDTLFEFTCYLLRKQARRVLQHQVVRYVDIPLSPVSGQRLLILPRKILVLDLDETLIHSHHDGIVRPMVKPGTPPDFILRVTIDRHPVRFFVYKRPHVDYFLSVVASWYDLVIFTASMEVYGSAVADKLDNGRNLLNRRYYRQHCTMDYGSYTKDLAIVCSDLSSVFIVDNSPVAYRLYPENAVPIKSWFCDPCDTELLNLLPFLDALRFVNDVRSVLGRSVSTMPQSALQS
uniref:CTD nuclear envelope phosphatase 1 homolog n=1 Tax=Trichuris muris TaxID=70415 RepID=A0A5S6QBC5_TRIMR